MLSTPGGSGKAPDSRMPETSSRLAETGGLCSACASRVFATDVAESHRVVGIKGDARARLFGFLGCHEKMGACRHLSVMHGRERRCRLHEGIVADRT